MPNLEFPEHKNLALRLLSLTSTWMSLSTIASTITLTQYDPRLLDSSSDVSVALGWTAPALIDTSSTLVNVWDLRSRGASVMVYSSSGLLSTPTRSSFAISETDEKPSTVASEITLKSLTSISPYLSISRDIGNDQDLATAPDMPPAAQDLSEGQVTAIIASVISVTFFVVAISIAIRCFVVRRRQYCVEEIPKRDLGVSPESTIPQIGEQGSHDETRISIADSNRSSIWGDMGHSVVPASTFSGDVLDSRLWPLPPGHSERYTFFSERSSSTVDEESEMDHWRGGSQDESCPTGRGYRSGVESRCDSVWGISEATLAAGIAR
ncbi:hypothetical protein F4776DRAFT_350775 [Hypoxylon sp. NC0597]|nr:hypothetical protein F4776DRAFT_350775 [Hypoxylon sp. NC0597]